MKSVKDQINKVYREKVEGALELVMQKTAVDIQADLTAETPVDTGRARSNWLMSLNQPASFTSLSTGGSSPINLNGTRYTDIIYITNNLPYIERLNEGSSKQAPARFVDNIILRRVRTAKTALRGLLR